MTDHSYDQSLDDWRGDIAAPALSPLAVAGVGHNSSIAEPHENDLGMSCPVCGEDRWPGRPCDFAAEHPRS